MARISQDSIRRVREATDIVDLIQQYIPLRRAGTYFECSCPFHKDKTPSFKVHAGRQTWRCYSCNQGGSVVDFLMLYERLEFVEAVERLGERSGIELEYDGATLDPSQRAQAKDRKSRLHEVMEWAQKWFARNLYSKEGAEALKYLEKRELPPAVIKAWGLGYAPDSFDRFLIEASQKFGDVRLLDDCGLTRVSESGKRFDFFRHRLLFPIRDRQGRTVAFGARKMREDDPGGKYINSPSTDIYDKSRVLYGMDRLPMSEFNRARPPARRLVVIVEGYMDVIACHRAGVDCAVAPCGTAITPDQLRTLSPYAPRMILLMDGDAAGQASMERIAGEVAAQGLNVLASSVPDGKDPDDFLRLHGPEGFGKILESGIDLFRFKLQALGRRMDLTNPAEKRAAVGEVLEIVNAATDPVLRAELLRRTAEFFRTPESGLAAALKLMRPRRKEEGEAPAQPALAPVPVNERTILVRMLTHPALLRPVGEFLHPEDFESPAAGEVSRAMFNALDEYGEGALDSDGQLRGNVVLDLVPADASGARQLLVELLEGDLSSSTYTKGTRPEDDEFDLDGAVREIRRWSDRRRRDIATTQAKDAPVDYLSRLRSQARR